ncbi:hypothetical protein ACEQ8H_001631 [Pleosporales sp. CAS-2024a]
MSASLAPECNEVKERYDNCFLKWYSEKFLRGAATTDECKPIFEQYEKCLSKALSDRGIDKMLKEVRDDNRENDAEHMKPGASGQALPFAAYYIFLQNRITYQRIKSNTLMGDKADPEQGNTDALFVASRAQVNFSENVPLILAVALLAELNGANRTYINSALGAVFALRIAHAEFGLMAAESKGVGRIVGFYGTQTALLSLAGYTAYLIQGYWQI